MDQVRSLSIETARIKVGTTFDFDLTDKFGRVVLKAGCTFDESIRAKLLADGGETLTILVMSEQHTATRVLLDSYPSESVSKLQDLLMQTERGLESFIDEVLMKRRAESNTLHGQLDTFLREVSQNTATALGVLAARWNSEQDLKASKLITRSTRLAWLSIITAMEMGLKQSELVPIGLAGLLHDISLFLHPDWQDKDFRINKRDEFVASYRKHSVESVDLLSITIGLSRNVSFLIAQLHEQDNGAGFPCGLRGSQLLPGSRILNVVDAYLETVNPTFRTRGLVPADALSHIVFQAAQGVFDREATKYFIDTISLYPIGSEVDLNDSKRAVVIRSNPGKPLDPVVRLIEEPNEVRDLMNSKVRIAGPTTGNQATRRLEPQKEMRTPFWDATTRIISDE